MRAVPASLPLLFTCAFVACDSRSEIPIGRDRCQTAGVDPFQLTALGPTDRSHWLQPWRAYLDTWPAARLRNAIGVGLSDAAIAKGFVPIMAQSGFARAIMVVGWGAGSFDEPNRLSADEADRIVNRLKALRASGIRPLILLYGHEGSPAPNVPSTLTLTEAAAMGDRSIRIDKAGVPGVVPGRTGLSDLTGYVAAEVLITSIASDGLATLSKPLPKALAAGEHKAATLKFLPWSRPQQKPGQTNAWFEETVAGWISFVHTVTDLARTTLGDSEFDVELWNELVTGAKYLDIDHYYDPPIDGTADDGAVSIPREILTRTVTAIHDPSWQLPATGIGDGFANTDWSYAASQEVPGATAMDRHVSVQPLQFPRDATLDNARALGAQGKPDGMRMPDGTWKEPWTPTYNVLFPELPLNAILAIDARRPGQLVRDLSPVPSLDVNGVAHGRNQKAPQAAVAPQLWVTAISTRPPADALAPPGWSSDDLWHFKAKTTLRTISAYVSKGASLVSFYAPEDDLALVNYAEVDGGVVLRALARFRSAFSGPADVGPPRALSLVTVRGCDAGVLVPGDGTPAHPGLLDRDAVAFFPFQTTPKQFVVATYVMTRDLLLERTANASISRFDLPEKSFDLVVSGVAGNVLVEASDPLLGRNVEVTVKARSKDRLVVAMPLTDSVRLLRLTEP